MIIRRLTMFNSSQFQPFSNQPIVSSNQPARGNHLIGIQNQYDCIILSKSKYFPDPWKSGLQT